MCCELLCIHRPSSPTVTEERALFLREQSGRMYRTSAYFLSKLLIELPLNTGLSCLFGVVGYTMVGMVGDGMHVVKFLFLLALLGHAIASIGLLLGCIIHIPIVAVMLCPLTVIPFMLTCGFFLNLNSIPNYLQWLTIISPHRYAFAGLMGLEFSGLKLHCDAGEMSTILLRGGGSTPEMFTYCSVISGQQVLDLLSLPPDEYNHDIVCLLVLCLVFRVLAFIVLEMSIRERQMQINALTRAVMKRSKMIVRGAMEKIRSNM
jgi:ABC-type multidrug transport system permease subunit